MIGRAFNKRRDLFSAARLTEKSSSEFKFDRAADSLNFVFRFFSNFRAVAKAKCMFSVTIGQLSDRLSDMPLKFRIHDAVKSFHDKLFSDKLSLPGIVLQMKFNFC